MNWQRAIETKKNIVWAYDELQNILNVKMRSPAELFGQDDDGEPRISLARAERIYRLEQLTIQYLVNAIETKEKFS